MIYYLKYDTLTICKHLVNKLFQENGLSYSFINLNEVDINRNLSEEALNTLRSQLNENGVEIISSQKSILVQKIKEAIIDLVNQEDKLILSKTSQHLSKKLNQSYRFLSGVFSEVTYSTIENYIILQKIEKAKELISNGEFTFAEVSWKLNYSSAAHFSMQFKNTTGLTPTQFKKIIIRRRVNAIENAAQ